MRFLHGRSGWPKSGHFQAFPFFRVPSLSPSTQRTSRSAPVTGRDEAPRPVSGVVVRRCGFARRPAPFSGQLSPWPAFGTPGGVWSRSGTGSRPEWGEPRIPHRCPGAWPCRFFPGCGAASIPCALESGLAGVRTRGVSPAWLPALLVSALPVASASWVGAWPSVTSLLPVCSSCGGVLPCWLALAERR